MRPPHPSLSLPTELNLKPLSPISAHLLSLLFTSGYVGSIYLSNVFSRAAVPPHGRDTVKATSTAEDDQTPSDPVLQPITSAQPIPTPPTNVDDDAPKPGERDHSATIKRRMKAVGIATGLSVGGVCGLVCHLGGYRWGEGIILTARLLGLPISPPFPSVASIPTATLPYILAPTLLLGPLYATWLDGDLPSFAWVDGRLHVRWERFENDGWGLIGWRNYVVGPLTEEIVFRSSLLALALLSKAGMKSMVYTTPLYFGVAHAHHAWETYVKGGRNKAAAIRAIAGCIFQLTYTTLFGWFASYIYLRTGSIVPPLVSHTYCNLMGIYMPQIGARRHPNRKKWIWGPYLTGVVGFVWGLRSV